MRLAAFFDRIGPYLEGRAGTDDTRRLLYGPGAGQGQGEPASAEAATLLSLPEGGPDAQRLAIYGRFCRIHRVECLAGVYEHTRAVLRALGTAGSDRWLRLVEEYFAAYPMHHVELSENGSAFSAFLDEKAQADLPPFVSALADFEWWEWRTHIAPDDAGDTSDPADAKADEGPLRLASTVELRPYRFDFVAWLDPPEAERLPAPVPRDSLVLFWRDRDLAPHRETAEPIELAVLKALVEGTSLAPPAGITDEEWDETLADLHAAGIVLGAKG